MTLKEKFSEVQDAYHNRSSECEVIADEFAIGFLEWFDKNAYGRGENSFLLWNNDKEPLTPKELLEIYKKEKQL